MLARLFQTAKSLTDARRAWRWLNGQTSLDVVCISSLSDDAERARLLAGGSNASELHLPGPRQHVGSVAMQTLFINSTQQELGSNKGRQAARRQCLAALAWAQARGARVVLLSAGTRWLFGRDAAPLKARFPDLTFTIGDNGCALLLSQAVDRVLERAELAQARVLVLAPYTGLGKALGSHLAARGMDVVGWGPTPGLLAENAPTHGMHTVNNLDSVGPVDLVVACGQGTKPRLGGAELLKLRDPERRLLVLDATAGATVDARTLAVFAGQVLRQDAGLAHAGGAGSGAVFGSVAEAVALFHTLHIEQDPAPLQHNWFEIEPAASQLVQQAFERMGMRLMAPARVDLNGSNQPAATRFVATQVFTTATA